MKKRTDGPCRVLIFALFGGDAALTESILRAEDIESTVCGDLDELCSKIAAGAGAVVLTEEALVPKAASAVLAVLSQQPSWSDLPVIVSTAERYVVRDGYGMVAALGERANVTLLERPVSVRSLLSAVRSALRARMRQYETRALLDRLSASESRFRRVQEAAPYGLMILKPVRSADAIVDFEWVYVNPAAEVMAKRSSEALLGKHMTVEFPGVLANENLARYIAVYEGKKRDTGREFFYRHDGFDNAYHNIAFRLDDDLAVLFEDITERKFAENERVGLLAREQEARERAETANRLKDEFLATVSHELRTPLNAVLGWAQMLKGGSLDEFKRRRAIDAIERNAVAQAELIEDLLDMSRIVSGKIRLSIDQVDVAKVVEAACDSVRPALLAKHIELTSHIDPEVTTISADAARLQQVIWNLLSNSAKFSADHGHVALNVRAVGEMVEFEVKDDGQGIEPEFMPFLFRRFHQADSTVTRSHGGLGLGLAICHQLAELHGGTIEAKSGGSGQGATFCVRLPCKRALEVATSEPPSSRVGDDALPPELQGAKVLVVDDERDARELMVTLLGQCGATTIEAASASEALEAMAQHPDLIVSDIGMPKVDGYELIRRIRALPPENGGRTPAVALTAFAQADDRKKALTAGFEAHIAKPVEPIGFVHALADLARKAAS